MYKRISNGFSLVELMVVIAIVGILSAFAVPTYKTYVAKARIARAVIYMDALVQKSILYASTTGKFANAAQLGLTTVNNGTVFDDAVGYDKVPYFRGQDQSGGISRAWDISNCGGGGYTEIYFSLDAVALGMPNAQAYKTNIYSQVQLSCKIWNYQGQYYKYCQVTASTCNNSPSCYATTNWVDGWVNYNPYSPQYPSWYGTVSTNYTCN